MFFVIFMLLFAVVRLGLYLHVVWSSTLRGATRVRRRRVRRAALLFVLLGLQVYWFAPIVKVAIKVVTSGAAEDVRSDDEDEDEEPKKKK